MSSVLGKRDKTRYPLRCNLLNCFKSNPSKQHWVTAKRILRYLKKTADLGIIYRLLSNEIDFNSLIAYSDADWTGDQDDEKYKRLRNVV